MARRMFIALLGTVACLAAPLLASPPSLAASTTAESGNPINDQGSSYEYRSNITGVSPSVPGLSFQVLEFADRILLTNHTGRTVTIYGYEGEPYARVLANGAVEQNERSPATYLNTNFYAQVSVPSSASASDPPQWKVIDRTGQFEWHDHRIHWMSPVPPAKVKNKSQRTLIFNWQVPIAVGTTKGAIAGQLYWTPESSKAPVAVIIVGVAIAVAGLLFVLFVRRRRARAALASSDGADSRRIDPPAEEAW
ncbi:MAG TPA: hypothetical protein VK655_02645 [Solirubrobacteraceae bacterium]|nr:hypothetical protein [Solirubrobacteraceae bacterium]